MVRYTFPVAGEPQGIAVFFGKGSDLDRIGIAGVLWLLVMWLLYTAFRRFLNDTSVGRSIVAKMSAEQRESFVMWIVEFIVTTVALIVFWHYAGDILSHGSYNMAFHHDSPDTDWRQPTRMFATLQDAIRAWSFAGQPVIFLYLYEIFAVSPLRERQVSHHLLTMHHLLAIMMLVYNMKATTATLNPYWAQMMGFLFNHMIVEQLMWLGLIWYRLKLPFYGPLLVVATVFEIFSRFVLWGICFYTYAHLCFLSCKLTMWEVIWRPAFPILALLMMLAQAAVIRIHVLLTLKAIAPRRSAAPEQRSGEDAGVETDAVSDPTSPTFGDEMASPTHSVALSPFPQSSPRDSRRSSRKLPTFASDEGLASSPSAAASIPSTPGPLSSSHKNAQARDGKLSVVSSEPFGEANAAAPNPPHRKQHKAGSTFPFATAAPGYFTAAFIAVIIGIFYGAEVVAPDSSIVENRCPRVAVVGGGIAGISAAWSLTRDNDFEVTLFEATGRFGGAAYSHIHTNGRSIEMGVQYYGNQYHNFFRLLDALNVSFQSDLRGLSGSLEDTTGEQVTIFNTYANLPIVDARGHALSKKIAAETHRFERLVMRELPDKLTEHEMMTTTLGEILETNGFSRQFIDYYILSCLQSRVTVRVNAFDMPIAIVYFFEKLFSSCSMNGKVLRDVVPTGSKTYIDALIGSIEKSGGAVYSNTTVRGVQHPGATTGSVRLLVNGSWQEFDQVIFAMQKKDTLRILTDASSDPLPADTLYRTVLGDPNHAGKVSYETAVGKAHDDTAFLTRKLRGVLDHGCHNIDGIAFVTTPNASYSVAQMMSPAVPKRPDTTFQAHVPTPAATTHCSPSFTVPYAYFHASDDPIAAQDGPSPSKTFLTVEWEQAAHDVSFFRGARSSHAIQGERRMWFAGAEFVGVNSHDAAISSGFVAAHGCGAAYPFDRDAVARSSFIKMRKWMLYGQNFLIPYFARRENREERCPRCP